MHASVCVDMCIGMLICMPCISDISIQLMKPILLFKCIILHIITHT